MTSTNPFRLLVVIPVFNHAHAITDIVQCTAAIFPNRFVRTQVIENNE